VEEREELTLRERAAGGDAGAQYLLGARLLRGEGPTRNYAEAEHWLRLSADQGVPGAQFRLGYMYDSGKGLPRDAKEAARWYQAAAEQGDREAQHNLALLAWHGDGVPQDRFVARRLMDRALADPDDFRRTMWDFVRRLCAWSLVALALFLAMKALFVWFMK
jgi:TPR repeat protein